jgi:hypothetical protein
LPHSARAQPSEVKCYKTQKNPGFIRRVRITPFVEQHKNRAELIVSNGNVKWR